ncbi:ATP-binding protein [Candidatus Electronema sp. PJ]|uniref:ATP-binding protein n=1 Tax=Candidatus Electronema sp. PJ TaxID=3401572 RepID=UPI003AA8AD32
MNLLSVSIENFRCYQAEVKVDLSDLTVFIGKNDSGKSSVLEALEVFFNNETVKIEKDDCNIYSDNKEIKITCEFSDFPGELTLDAGAQTTLAEEYLLTKEGTLKIQKRYDCSKQRVTAEIFVLSYHPTAKDVANLLDLKEKELQKLARDRNLDCPMKGNPVMRKAIWNSEQDLKLAEVAIPVNKSKEDSKRIWEQLEAHLPIFALFQSDRNSTDSDDEVQNPMKAAVSAAIAEVQDEIEQIQLKVQEKAREIAENTHQALKKIDPKLASELTPQFIPPTPAKWTGLFSVNMNTDGGIPLNKRGSGVRRLVLVSFFKAEAERKLRAGSKRSIIYAIEEPETAQHPNNQRILIESFKSLSTEDGCKILLTTHSPGFAAELPSESIRFISKDDTGKTTVESGVDVFGNVAESLGVIPDSRVKCLLCVEGPTDVSAFKYLSKALNQTDSSIPDLTKDERVAFVVLGGSTLKHWVNENYLKLLKRPEVHIYDSDVTKKYGDIVKEVNKRLDGSWGVLTKKREIENYLHPKVIKESCGVDIEITEHVDVPKIFSEPFSFLKKYDRTMGKDKAKKQLAEKAFPLMTAEMIRERDPDGEVEGWFRKIAEIVNS